MSQPDEGLILVASCGRGLIDGAVWRPGDGVKHLGPPAHLHIRPWSRLFKTRCGLGPDDGDWQSADAGQDDDCWCPPCLAQYGIVHTVEAV